MEKDGEGKDGYYLSWSAEQVGQGVKGLEEAVGAIVRGNELLTEGLGVRPRRAARVAALVLEGAVAGTAGSLIDAGVGAAAVGPFVVGSGAAVTSFVLGRLRRCLRVGVLAHRGWRRWWGKVRRRAQVRAVEEHLKVVQRVQWRAVAVARGCGSDGVWQCACACVSANRSAESEHSGRRTGGTLRSLRSESYGTQHSDGDDAC